MKRVVSGAASLSTESWTSSGTGPPTLYAACIRRVASQSSDYPLQHKVKNGRTDVPSLTSLLSERISPMTEAMRCDLILELHTQKRYSSLLEHLSNADVLLSVLSIVSRRTQMHAVFQTAVDRGANDWREHSQREVNENTGNMFLESVVTSVTAKLQSTTATAQIFTTVQSGLNLCSFLMDAGWYEHAERLLRRLLDRLGHLRRLRSHSTDADLDAVEREASLMLLHALSCYCKLTEAEVVFKELSGKLDCLVDGGAATSFSAVRRLPSKGQSHVALCLASFHLEFSCYAFVRSDYRSAYFYAMSAVSHLRDAHPPRLVVDVLRQASKACVVRRKFARAEVLVREAVLLAREVYGEKHPKYADALIDLGFYLLNVDCIFKSIQAYGIALKVREECFCSVANLRVALAHEDLAYASYVHEYNTGHFSPAKMHAEKALDIWARLLPNNHLLKASSQRVLALILEEIAIDESDKSKSRRLLRKAEELHLSALDLAVRAFGEQNVQTSKHYGNLGRLYQSMEQFNKAEAMHLRAIAIKESLLGDEDYEVALSIGHLASLYNYDLRQFDKAEPLYLRSVLIGLKLFGPTYSGLEYDYRGLIRVYQETLNWTKFVEFSDRWREWKELRDKKEDSLRSGEAEALVEGKTRSVSAVVADLHGLGAFSDDEHGLQADM